MKRRQKDFRSLCGNEGMREQGNERTAERDDERTKEPDIETMKEQKSQR